MLTTNHHTNHLLTKSILSRTSQVKTTTIITRMMTIDQFYNLTIHMGPIRIAGKSLKITTEVMNISRLHQPPPQ